MIKRLLIYATQLMPRGGIESHIVQFVNEISRDPIQIDLLVPNFQMSVDVEMQLKDHCHKLVVNKSNSKNFSNKVWLLKELASLTAYRYDCLYTNGQGDSIGLCGRILRYKKWVHHHHTSGDLLDQNTWGASYRKSLTKADAIIACSTKNAKSIAVNLNRDILSIPCFSRDLGSNNVKKSKTINSKLQFGYYGRLIPEKGIDLLCRLSQDADCQRIQFNIWGNDPNYPESFFKSYPNLKYHGAFDGKKELKAVISSLDAFVLLSTHPEGLPISLLEVMSAGLPWLATDRGGITDIALDKNSTRVLAYDSTYEEFKQAILNLAHDIEYGTINNLAQIQLYKEKFAAPVVSKKWNSVLFSNL